MPDMQEKVDRYVDSRLTGSTGYLGYYDSTAKRMKRRHLQTRTAAAIGAVLIPVVSNLPWKLELWSVSVDVARVGTSVIGLGVALILALEGVFHFKDQWQNFRGSEQYPSFAEIPIRKPCRRVPITVRRGCVQAVRLEGREGDSGREQRHAQHSRTRGYGGTIGTKGTDCLSVAPQSRRAETFAFAPTFTGRLTTS